MEKTISGKIDFAARLAANSALISRNVTVSGRRTSVRLEPEMWGALRQIAACEGVSVHDLCTLVHGGRKEGTSFTAALRVFLMAYYRYQSVVRIT